MSHFSEPPYFLLVAGVSCTNLWLSLQQRLNKLCRSGLARASKAIAKLQIGGLLLVPFLGICAGVYLSFLRVRNFWLSMLSHAVAVPLTLLLGLLVWLQLGSMLNLVERKGFQAIDIDSWPKGGI